MFSYSKCLRRALCLSLFLLAVVQAHSQQLTVMSSGGFAQAYKLLAPEFEKAGGAHLTSIWGPSMGTTPGAIPMRLARGEHGDVVIMARSELDVLVKKGLVVSGSQVDLVRSRIGMAVRAGAPLPDISTVEKFKKVLLAAHSIAYSDSASGVYIGGELYQKLGLARELAAKSKQIPAEPVGLSVARGDVEIGFQQMSELKPIPGITIVGPIPDELQKITLFAAGIVASSTDQDAARALIRFLASTSSCAVIEQSALDPVSCPAVHSHHRRYR
jgi:molybdate transport system substrate-binding protein